MKLFDKYPIPVLTGCEELHEKSKVARGWAYHEIEKWTRETQRYRGIQEKAHAKKERRERDGICVRVSIRMWGLFCNI